MVTAAENLRTEPGPSLSVIVCAHNPRTDYFQRVLGALRAQSLPPVEWELLLVDNASAPPLAARFDMAWHRQARHLVEPRLGLTAARLHGIRAANGNLVVFVDDDNVLAPDYLMQAERIANEHPRLGAWSGRVDLEFEAAPPAWTRKYWSWLVHRPVTEDQTVVDTTLREPLPCGAGLCVRREVARAYSGRLASAPLRQSLDRCGASLVSAGDTDLALTACDLGWERGVFKDLHVTHLIQPGRLTEDYLVRLAEGIRYSARILELLRPPHREPPRVHWFWHARYWCAWVTKRGRHRRFFMAAKEADRRARAVFEELRAREGLPRAQAGGSASSQNLPPEKPG